MHGLPTGTIHEFFCHLILPVLSPCNSCIAMLVLVSWPNRRHSASTLAVYVIFSCSGSPTKYIWAPLVNDKKKSDGCSSSLHWPSTAHSLNWFTQPTKSSFPSYFSSQKLNFLSSTLLESMGGSSAPRAVIGLAGSMPGSQTRELHHQRCPLSLFLSPRLFL